jgi:hypothetical protein
VRGCLTLIGWTATSLMLAGPLLTFEDAAYSGYPGAPKPSVLPTSTELVALMIFGIFWLAGIALIATLGWLWRAAREDRDESGLAAVIVALAWALMIGWLTVGTKPLFFPNPAHTWDTQLWTWTISGPVELLFLPSFGVLLWCGGLAVMLFAVRSVWRWLPAE